MAKSKIKPQKECLRKIYDYSIVKAIWSCLFSERLQAHSVKVEWKGKEGARAPGTNAMLRELWKKVIQEYGESPK